MKLYLHIIEQIQSLRGKLWRTQAELAKRSGLTQPQISKLLKQQGTIGFEAGCALLESLGAQVTIGAEVHNSSSLDSGVISQLINQNQQLVEENKELLKEISELKIKIAKIDSSNKSSGTEKSQADLKEKNSA
jgi:transcriptional regulator with XRE-family HTH domain